MTIQQADAQHIIDALRLGTVPSRGLHHYAVGQEREFSVLQEELKSVAAGQSRLKAVRGGYGSGKTFVTSRLAEEALASRFVVSQVVLNRSGYSLHQLERLYRGIMQGLVVRGTEGNALGSLLDRWADTAEEYVVNVQGVSEDDELALRRAVELRMDVLLKDTVRERPSFAAALHAYYGAHLKMDHAGKRQVLGWLMADPHASARHISGVRGHIDSSDVFAYLQEFVRMVRQMGRPGLVIVLDELDEMRQLPRNLRHSAWANLRDLTDRIGRNVEGLYVVLAGTPDVYQGQGSIEELAPLAQRLAEPTADSEHPNLRGAQLPLQPLSEAQLLAVMQRVHLLWQTTRGAESRLPAGFEAVLAQGWTARLGNRSPRVAIREFVSVLDRLHDYPAFDPLQEYIFDLPDNVFTPEERSARPEAQANEMFR
jgi:hypothetical protein